MSLPYAVASQSDGKMRYPAPRLGGCMSQFVAVSSPASSIEVLERYSRVRHALFPTPPPQPRVPMPKPKPTIVYSSPLIVRGPTKRWLERRSSKARQIASEGRRLRAIEAALRAEVPPDERAANIGAIIDATAQFYGITRDAILSIELAPYIVRARHVAMFLAADRKDMSFAQMGRVFNRDHSSVFHAMKKVRALVEQGDPIAADVDAIRSRLQA